MKEQREKTKPGQKKNYITDHARGLKDWNNKKQEAVVKRKNLEEKKHQ